MRWKDVDKDPEEGAIRIRRKFLLLPTCIDGEWRWLERATWREEYMWYTVCMGIYTIEWVPIGWED